MFPTFGGFGFAGNREFDIIPLAHAAECVDILVITRNQGA